MYVGVRCHRAQRLPSEYSTYKTVKARFWPQLEPFLAGTSSKPFKLTPAQSQHVPLGRERDNRLRAQHAHLGFSVFFLPG